MSSPSSPKRNVKGYFEEISTFDLFFQLTYMSATAAAGISRSRVFQLARTLAATPAKYFKNVHEVAENLRYNYPDAVRLVGEKTKEEDMRSFLLRLSDALRSGEPLAGFLAREASVQGEHYSNDYLRRIESLKKWTDGYTAVAVSAALVVIINMVSSMIYNIGTATMLVMVMVAVSASFGVAWILFRSSPQETKFVPLKVGCKTQRRSLKLARLLLPMTFGVSLVLALLKVDKALVMIVAGLIMLPIGIACNQADKLVSKKEAEISSFYRSLGGTATSRGTTLKEALTSMKFDSFPTLKPDIRMLDLRLKSFGDPALCWRTFGLDTGSKLADQSTGVFYEAVNLGGDPEIAGNLVSLFTMKTAMLRSQRQGVGGSFAYLTLVMHTVLAGLMVFLLGILEQFAIRLTAAMGTLGEGSSASATMGLQNMFSFNAPQINFLTTITVGMILILAVVNAFAIVACEGTHLIKITYYLSFLLILSGLCFIIIGPLASTIV